MKQQFEQYLEGIREIYPNIRLEQEVKEAFYISDVEKNMNVQFNEELRTWFQLIGNVEYGISCLLAGLEIYSIDEMFEEWKSWREFDDDDNLNNADYYSSMPIGAVKCRYTNSKWIPLAHDYASNYIGVDLDPDENGLIGQIINFGRDENNKRVISNSIKELLQLLVKYQDEMIIDTEGSQVSYINEEEIHPIDWLKKKTVIS